MADEQAKDDLQDRDRRRFLKTAAFGVADALGSAARIMGVPGIDRLNDDKPRAQALDQPSGDAGDPLFAASPRRRENADQEDPRRDES